MDKRPIGVMDSGLGGLSVIRVLREQMPQESVIFVGFVPLEEIMWP